MRPFKEWATRVLVFSCLAAAIPSARLFAVDYYVDFEDGLDTNNGLSTSTAWRHAPGDSNATGNAGSVSLVPGDAVTLKGGVAYRGSIRVGASGAQGNPIRYKGDGWGEQKAILDGSDILEGTWTQCTSAADCGGNPHWPDIYYVDAPEGFSFFTPLYEDDEFLWFSQDPNPADPFYYDRREEFTTVPFGDPSIAITRTSLMDPRTFTQSDSNYWARAYVQVWRIQDVVTVREIASFDPASDTIHYDDIGGDLYTDRDEYYSLLNHVSLIDRPGEYCFDGEKIYVWPRSSEHPALHQYTVARRGVGFNISGCSNIVIEGFTIRKQFGDFRDYSGGIGVLNGTGTASGLSVRRNVITRLRSMEGQGAVQLSSVSGVLIDGNRITENQRNSGMLCRGSDIVVTGNTVTRVGRVGIWFMGVTRGQIVNNKVFGVKGSHGNGVSVYQNSQDVLVFGNHIFDSPSAFTAEASANLSVVNNIIDGGDDSNTVNFWYGMTGANAFLGNVLVRNSRNLALAVGATTVVINNVIDGGGAEVVTRRNNVYTGLSWDQAERYGWSLAEGELVQEDLNAIFVDPENGDFHLREGSPAIDSGVDVGPYLPTDVFPDFDFGVDMGGNRRPQGAAWDIGPYELVRKACVGSWRLYY